MNLVVGRLVMNTLNDALAVEDWTAAVACECVRVVREHDWVGRVGNRTVRRDLLGDTVRVSDDGERVVQGNLSAATDVQWRAGARDGPIECNDGPILGRWTRCRAHTLIHVDGRYRRR